jgi:general secretion pathway protein K
MRLIQLRSPDQTPNGFIIVAVLWILGALAVLATIYALYVKETAVAFAALDERLQAKALAWSGVELAAYQLTATPEAQPSQGRFTFRQGSAQVAVDFRGEGSRIDLNFAPKEVLAGLFTGFGVRRDEAEGYAERIVGWRTPPRNPAAGEDSEAGLYRAAGRNYGPRRAPFQHVSELALVAGLPPALVDRALPYLTVYSGRAEVNVLNAAPEVIAALPGMTPDRLQLLLTQRAGAPQDILRAQLGMAAQYATVQPSRANRVTVDVQFEAPTPPSSGGIGRGSPTSAAAARGRIRSEAVILILEEDSEPFHLLSWRDDIDPSAGERPRTGVR